MADSIDIRPADATADIEAVSRLLEGAKLIPIGPDSQFGSQYVLATFGEKIVGVAGIEVHGEYGLLRSVCLEPQYRSLRIGAALVENRLEWSRNQGLKAIYLLTTTATKYWPRFGFVRIDRDQAPSLLGQSQEWSEACPAESTAMKLDLG